MLLAENPALRHVHLVVGQGFPNASLHSAPSAAMAQCPLAGMVPVLLGAKQNEFRWAVYEQCLFYRKSLLCEGTDAQVPNATLYLIASAGTHMPRTEHLNGDGNKDRNLYLRLPKDCL